MSIDINRKNNRAAQAKRMTIACNGVLVVPYCGQKQEVRLAPRKQLFHPDDVKQKIQASQLINRLTTHALSATPIMDSSQVTAAVKLLAKVIPDLKAVEHSGEGGGPLQVLIQRYGDDKAS